MTWTKTDNGTIGSITMTSPWSGKKWLAIGDSITQANGMANPGPYHKQIATQLGLTAINGGKGGWGYFNAETGKYYSLIDSNTIDTTADVVTVFLGTNDWYQTPQTVPLTTSNLGQLGDTDKTATFYGAVDYTLKNLATKFNGKPIGVITPLIRGNAWPELINPNGNVTLTQVVDAIIKVAKKYQMPVLDLYRESNWNIWDNNFGSVYTMDGLHPTVAGHTILARKIVPFLNSL